MMALSFRLIIANISPGKKQPVQPPIMNVLSWKTSCKKGVNLTSFLSLP